MKIDGKGFVSEDLLSEKEPPEGTYADLFKILFCLNNFAENLKSELTIENQETNKEKQKVISVVLFIRIIEIVQSAVILALHGVREDLSSMFRIFLDAYFVFANTCISEDFISTYFQTDEPNRLKLLNVASQHKSELFKELNDYATKEIRDELDKKIKEEKIQPFKSQLYAVKAGCADMYDSMYRLTSASIHTTPRCLDHYVEADEIGNITVVKHKPDPETTDRLIYDFSFYFIQVIKGICELFEIDKIGDIERFKKDLKKAGNIFVEG